ncbi:extracellular catalytic domain type 2 short-chain-length polyhydroxyalkanoate depolymerase [Mangrovicoccus ximenensis]|uniref:extracellular catalytic domain type 2 short-chain-length polyhydroxyalkanoate depolymerase n=1 Tax=Mangrovicoccus ximenensis TaxID=1911570 RepID=UPI000D3BCDD8|nr:PHB depolymerase family esterase [Mangrovicoccus ximenensis]
MRAILLPAALCALPALADPLPQLNLVQREVTVSGLSSGAAMAVQLQTAFSSHVTGAGIVAGAPFGCAEGNVFAALSACMQQGVMAVVFEDTTERLAGVVEKVADGIDPIEGLADDRIYLFHGTADDTVSARAMDLLQESYGVYGVPAGNIEDEDTFEAPHAFLTEETGDCLAETPSFINACGVDMAGDILGQLGLLGQPEADAVPGHLIEFEQDLYADDAPGMGDMALAYIPAACTAGEECRLHIALHGCRQGLSGENGDAFATRTGYNGWAEANNIVVLYPQAEPTATGNNPKGCWDWWGYSVNVFPMGQSLAYLEKDAPQMAAIAAMAAALGAPLTD